MLPLHEKTQKIDIDAVLDLGIPGRKRRRRGRMRCLEGSNRSWRMMFLLKDIVNMGQGGWRVDCQLTQEGGAGSRWPHLGGTKEEEG